MACTPRAPRPDSGLGCAGSQTLACDLSSRFYTENADLGIPAGVSGLGGIQGFSCPTQPTASGRSAGAATRWTSARNSCRGVATSHPSTPVPSGALARSTWTFRVRSSSPTARSSAVSACGQGRRDGGGGRRGRETDWSGGRLILGEGRSAGPPGRPIRPQGD